MTKGLEEQEEAKRESKRLQHDLKHNPLQEEKHKLKHLLDEAIKEKDELAYRYSQLEVRIWFLLASFRPEPRKEPLNLNKVRKISRISQPSRAN